MNNWYCENFAPTLYTKHIIVDIYGDNQKTQRNFNISNISYLVIQFSNAGTTVKIHIQ